MGQLLVILIVLFVPLSDDLGWHPSSAGGWLWLVQLTFPFALWWLTLLVASAERRRPSHAFRMVTKLRLVVPVWHLVAVLLVGWASEVRAVIGDLVVIDEIVIAIPALVACAVGRGFVAKWRLELLTVAVPLFVLQAWSEAVVVVLGARVDPGWLNAIQLAGVLALVAIMPEVLRRVWSTEPLPDGEVRARIETSLKLARVRAREILIWNTGGRLANAAVMGVIPRVRYILLTDVLLAVLEPEELEGVAAHEIGHVRHKHLVWLVLAILAALSASVIVVELLGLARPWAEIVAILAAGIGVFFGFGTVSRIFERQADAFAVAHLSRGWGEDRISERAVDVFSSALAQVAMLGGMRRSKWTWRHGSIAERQRRIARLILCEFDSVPADRVARRAVIVIMLTLTGSIGLGFLIR